MKYAFKCRNCGALEPAGSAGDRHLPAACHVCGHGVTYDPITGLKTYVDDNWIVLASLDEAQLAEYELTPDQVEAHAGQVAYQQGQQVTAEAVEGAVVEDTNE